MVSLRRTFFYDLEDVMSEHHPIAIRMIDHVVIRADDLERMIAFYRDVLGCLEERRSGKMGLVQLRAGNSLIDLVDVAGPLGRQGGRGPDRAAPNMDHFCVQVEPWDPDAITAHLKAHGIEAGDVVSRYGARGDGPSIYIDDPEGNTVELKGPPRDLS
jgi:catechol 2,3-dioxygenase-like lactoylglutathione lyase family enzyme